MDMDQFRDMFLTEAHEHLQQMGRLALNLEAAPADRERIDALFRAAHSVKGMAASMGYERTARLAHQLEDLMDDCRQRGEVPSGVADRLLQGVDLLEALLEDIRAGRDERDSSLEILAEQGTAEGEAGRSRAAEAPAIPAKRSWDVTVELSAETPLPAVRALVVFKELERLGEILSRHPSAAELEAGIRELRLRARLKTDVDQGGLKAALSALTDVVGVSVLAHGGEKATPTRTDGGSGTLRVQTRLLDRFIDLTGELVTSRYMLQSAAKDQRWQDVNQGLDRLSRQISDLHRQVLQVRMVPLDGITGRLPRLVRDLAQKSGKQVSLVVEGEELELDRTILESLTDPLMHMVRNAVDHGIADAGQVAVRARREKDLVVIDVSDDGRGLDPDQLRQVAVDRGLLSHEHARSLPDKEALQLVCAPGFSTAERVTETSGRGVGMDVVKAAVENLGGILRIESEPGTGTRFVLKLPLSVAIIQALIVECGGKRVGIPITRVGRTLDLERSQVRSSGKQLVFRDGDDLLPLLSLRKILNLPQGSGSTTLQVVLTEARGRRVGLVVDRLVGKREVFVKTLTFPLSRIPGLSGAAVLGDGSIVFIIDPQMLLMGRPMRTVFKRAGASQ